MNNAAIAPAKNLHQLFKKYGGLSLQYRQKCIGMLPEIYKQNIHNQHKMSIFEYAAKFAGISHEQIRVVLRLDKNFKNKPVLKKLLNEGVVSINKLARIDSVATVENQEFWAEQVQLLPKSAVETLVKDVRRGEVFNKGKVCEMSDNGLFKNNKFESQYGLQEPLFEEKSLPGQTFEEARTLTRDVKTSLNLDDDVIQKLQNLQQKGINVSQIIRDALSRREEEIAQEKERLAKQIHEKSPKPSRYIPIKIKRIIQKEQGTRCSINGCNKPTENLHHTQRYGLTQNHDPHFLAQMCKDHHTIAHNIDTKYRRVRAMALAP